MTAIEKALEEIREDACVLFGIHHTALSEGFGPAKRIINRVDEALAALEAEKPAEDAIKVAEYLFNMEYPNTPIKWMLSSAKVIQQYAEAYHERKMKESGI